jgi:cobalamin biosynthesis protein CobD/CbiB
MLSLSWLQPIIAVVFFLLFLFASHYIWDAIVRWLTVPTRVDSVQSLAKQYQRIYQQLGKADVSTPKRQVEVEVEEEEEKVPVNLGAMKDELQDFLQASLTH